MKAPFTSERPTILRPMNDETDDRVLRKAATEPNRDRRSR